MSTTGYQVFRKPYRMKAEPTGKIHATKEAANKACAERQKANAAWNGFFLVREVKFNANLLKVGQKVKVDETQGLGRSQWEGEVTRNDPKSPYIYVEGRGVRKYEVVGFAD